MAEKRKTASTDAKEVVAGAEAESLPIMTLKEVAAHNSAKDCFVVVDGFVCDVTKYLPDHPGSPEQLLEVAGERG
jgi:cytochrome-b5 reductase